MPRYSFRVDPMSTAPCEMLRQCALLRGRVLAFNPDRQPSSSPRHLVRLLLRVLDLFEARLSAVASPEQVAEIGGQLDQLVEHVGLLDGLERDRIPSALLAQLRQRLRQMPRVDGDLLLTPHPTWRHELEVVDLVAHYRALFVEHLSSQAMEVHFQDLPRALLWVRFSEPERDNVLLHPLLGHALGRLLADGLLAQWDMDLRDASLDDAGRRVIREIVADAIGVRLYGPAMVFALDHHGGRHATAGAPHGLRLAYALRQLPTSLLEGADLPHEPASRRDAVVGRLLEIKSRATTLDASFPFLERVWRELSAWDDLRGAWRDDPGAFMARVWPLVDRLKHRLPPNADERDPADPVPATDVHVFNACWVAHLELQAELALGRIGQEAYLETFDVQSRLGMKALDDLEYLARGEATLP